MSINLTIYRNGCIPFPEGSKLELLGDGNVLADSLTDAEGAVSFDVDASGAGRLAVRLAVEKNQSPSTNSENN